MKRRNYNTPKWKIKVRAVWKIAPELICGFFFLLGVLVGIPIFFAMLR